MVDGIVKWFDVKKGYGFLTSPEITKDDGSLQDIFVHFSKIQMEGFKKLEASEAVEFSLVRNEEGKPQAENVVPKGASA
jgi:cold shock protein